MRAGGEEQGGEGSGRRIEIDRQRTAKGIEVVEFLCRKRKDVGASRRTVYLKTVTEKQTMTKDFYGVLTAYRCMHIDIYVSIYVYLCTCAHISVYGPVISCTVWVYTKNKETRLSVERTCVALGVCKGA